MHPCEGVRVHLPRAKVAHHRAAPHIYMSSAFSQKILKTVKAHTVITPADIVTLTGISRATVQKYLKELTDAGYLRKNGQPPRVHYTATGISETVQETFVYKEGDGSLLFGTDGFDRWAAHRLPGKTHAEKINTYEKSFAAHERAKVDGLYFTMDMGLKMAEEDIVLDTLLCLDLYNMSVAEEMKRTSAAVLLEVVKGSGNRKKMKTLIMKYIERAVADIHTVIERERVDAVAFIPPTAVRPVQVMKLLQKEFESRNARAIPVLPITRNFPDVHGSRQEQKHIRSVRHRIQNARATYLVRHTREQYDTVLLIDDLVGSGATMNEVARQCKEKNIASRVHGLCLVGINTKKLLVVRKA